MFFGSSFSEAEFRIAGMNILKTAVKVSCERAFDTAAKLSIPVGLFLLLMLIVVTDYKTDDIKATVRATCL